jgi:hypothetical protein
LQTYATSINGIQWRGCSVVRMDEYVSETKRMAEYADGLEFEFSHRMNIFILFLLQKFIMVLVL